MPNDASKIRVGTPKVGGYFLSAPLATAVPTTATAALNAAYTVKSYVSEDGVTRSVTTETEDVKDWNGDTVRVLVTDKGAEFSCTLIETNQAVLEELYGVGNVAVAAGAFTVDYDGSPLPHKQYVFELKDGTRVGRIAINDGQLVPGGEVSYNKGAVIGYEVTIKCFLDATNKFFHEYWADAA